MHTYHKLSVINDVQRENLKVNKQCKLILVLFANLDLFLDLPKLQQIHKQQLSIFLEKLEPIFHQAVATPAWHITFLEKGYFDF